MAGHRIQEMPRLSSSVSLFFGSCLLRLCNYSPALSLQRIPIHTYWRSKFLEFAPVLFFPLLFLALMEAEPPPLSFFFPRSFGAGEAFP